MKYLKFNKKGNLEDILFLVIIIVFFVILCIPTVKIINGISTQAQSMDNLNAENKAVIADMETNFYDVIDKGFLVLLICGFLGILISAYFIDIHPIFSLIGFVFSIFILLGCAVLVGMAQQIMTNVPEVFNNFPIINHIMNNIFIYLVVFIAMVIIVLYGKFRG